MDFQNKFKKQSEKNSSLLCVGLDPDIKLIPKKFKNIFDFNKSMIDQTQDIVACYKPNIAFYEAFGIEGLKELKKTLEYLQKKFADIPIILDAKRADIANTAKMYAKSMFEYWGADAVTVYPNLGFDSLEPFFEYKKRMTVLLLKTSNPDSLMFQSMETKTGPYFLKMAKAISKWKINNYGILVGATYPKEMVLVREIFPDKFFLSPGLGSQGAEAEQIVKAGIDENGGGIAFNASRSIIYSEKPRLAAQKLRDEINRNR